MATHAGLHGGCTQELSEQARSVGGKLCSNKRMEKPLFTMERCDWLRCDWLV